MLDARVFQPQDLKGNMFFSFSSLSSSSLSSSTTMSFLSSPRPHPIVFLFSLHSLPPLFFCNPFVKKPHWVEVWSQFYQKRVQKSTLKIMLLFQDINATILRKLKNIFLELLQIERKNNKWHQGMQICDRLARLVQTGQLVLQFTLNMFNLYKGTREERTLELAMF